MAGKLRVNRKADERQESVVISRADVNKGEPIVALHSKEEELTLYVFVPGSKDPTIINLTPKKTIEAED